MLRTRGLRSLLVAAAMLGFICLTPAVAVAGISDPYGYVEVSPEGEDIDYCVVGVTSTGDTSNCVVGVTGTGEAADDSVAVSLLNGAESSCIAGSGDTCDIGGVAVSGGGDATCDDSCSEVAIAPAGDATAQGAAVTVLGQATTTAPCSDDLIALSLMGGATGCEAYTVNSLDPTWDGTDGSGEDPSTAPLPSGIELSMSPVAAQLDAAHGVALLVPGTEWVNDGHAQTTIACIPGVNLWGTPDVTAGQAQSCSGVDTQQRDYVDIDEFVIYARTYAENYNTSFREFGNDCTNFVSQALYHAGWEMQSGYWNSDAAWWYRTSSVPPAQTHSWGGAQNLANFMLSSRRAVPLYYWESVTLGDIVQVEYSDYNAGRLGHSMIVTAVDNNALDYLDRIYVSYHSSDKPGRLNKKLRDFVNSSPSAVRYVGWRLR